METWIVRGYQDSLFGCDVVSRKVHVEPFYIGCGSGVWVVVYVCVSLVWSLDLKR